MAKRRRGTAGSGPSTAPPPRRTIGRTRPIATGSTGGRRLLGPAVLVALARGRCDRRPLGRRSHRRSGVTVRVRVAAPAPGERDGREPDRDTRRGRASRQDRDQDRVRLVPARIRTALHRGGGVAPLRPAFYDAGARIGPGNWVHNLEHGYVVALYRCPDGQCPSNDVLAEFREFVFNGPSTATATSVWLPVEGSRRPVRRHGDAVRAVGVGPRPAARHVRLDGRGRLRPALDRAARAARAATPAELASPAGFEPATRCLEGSRSVH